MIPKIIHYIWINENPEIPDKQKECINSWKTLMPEYKLELWDFNRCKSLKIRFINEAIKAKKYAFASDVVRALALYKYGGIYLDTDILLYKDLTPLLKNNFISFIEYYPHLVSKQNKTYNKKWGIYRFEGLGILVACMASEKEHPYLLDVINFYKKARFKGRNKKYFMTTVADDIYASKLIPYGFQYIDELQNLSNDITIYPSNYFKYGTSIEQKEENPCISEKYGAHLCYGDWHNNKIYLLKYFINLFKTRILKQEI